MKKMLILTGIILVMVAKPESVRAALSADCASALLSLPPVSSHFTQRILERATAGLVYSNAETAHADFKKYLPSWVRAIESTVLAFLDTDLRIVQTQRDLLQNTACMRIDAYLLECKMDEVRAALHQAVVDQRTGSILRLKSLMFFLNQHLKVLFEGARDPSYQDPSWHQYYIFDDPAGAYIFGSAATTSTAPVCGNGIREVEEECDGGIGCDAVCQTEMCPFHTDYLPPNVVGFGCDLDILTPRRAHRPTFDEWASLNSLTADVSIYLLQAQKILALQQQVGVSPVAPAPRVHRTGAGCVRNVCEFNRQMFCTKNIECQQSGMGSCISGLMSGTCERNPTQQCMTDSECGLGDRCVAIEEASWLEPRGPFSIDKNEPRILDTFRQKREADGESREMPDSYKPNAGGFGAIFQFLARPALQIFSRLQEQGESTIFPIGSDPLLETQEALAPLRGAVGSFARLASDRSGMREFVIGLASFIRRTCVYQPCNMILEKIIRIALVDECFPYTSGEFLNDSCQSPRAEKCIQAAELDTDMSFPIPNNSCN